ncbi:hypothetical protein KH5_11870 [Urechidicola sp. KH5]
MKRVFKISTVVIALIVSLQVNAKSFGTLVEISKIENTLVNFKVTNFNDKVSIIITNNYGEVVYSDVAHDGVYSKNFNFEYLAEGAYEITFKGDVKRDITAFSIVDQEVFLGESKVVYNPAVNQIDNIITINKLLNSETDNFEIALFDTADNLLYKESISGELSVGRMYDISQLETGTYGLVMRHNGEVFYQTIVK